MKIKSKYLNYLFNNLILIILLLMCNVYHTDFLITLVVPLARILFFILFSACILLCLNKSFNARALKVLNKNMWHLTNNILFLMPALYSILIYSSFSQDLTHYASFYIKQVWIGFSIIMFVPLIKKVRGIQAFSLFVYQLTLFCIFIKDWKLDPLGLSRFQMLTLILVVLSFSFVVAICEIKHKNEFHQTLIYDFRRLLVVSILVSIYFHFMNYLIIWHAHLPSEMFFFSSKITKEGLIYQYLTLFTRYIIPLGILLSTSRYSNKKVHLVASCFVLIGFFFEYFYIFIPFSPPPPLLTLVLLIISIFYFTGVLEIKKLTNIVLPLSFIILINQNSIANTYKNKEGFDVFSKHGCINCHGQNQNIGPRLEFLYHSIVKLNNHNKIIADSKYIEESIFFPSKKIVHGYSDGIMPSYQNKINKNELKKLIEFMK